MASQIIIADSDLAALKDRIVVITGGSSGIGLATVEFLLSIGAKIVNGDMNEPAEPLNANATFIRTNVTDWKDLVNLFSKAKELHGRIDCVFANAGIVLPRAEYIEDILDDSGELQEPLHNVINVNLIGCINTVKLGIHHMRQQESGGSIVATASASSYQRFSAADYTIAKHGVLGLMRCLYHPLLAFPIRFNSVAPSWTATGIVPGGLSEKAGIKTQSPTVVARSVALLFADTSRHGQLIYSDCGTYTDIEGLMLEAGKEAMTKKTSDEEDRARLVEVMQEMTEKGEKGEKPS